MKFLQSIPHHLQYLFGGIIVAIWAEGMREYLLPSNPSAANLSHHIDLYGPNFWPFTLGEISQHRSYFTQEQWNEILRQGGWIMGSIVLASLLLPFFVARRIGGRLGWLLAGLLFILAFFSAVAMPTGMEPPWTSSGPIRV